MSEKEKMLNIKDSPQIQLPIPAIKDVSEDPRSADDKDNHTVSLKMEQASSKKEEVIDEETFVCVDGIILDELFRISNEKLKIWEIYRMLKDMEEVKFISKSIMNYMKSQSPIFILPDFSIYDTPEAKQKKSDEVQYQQKLPDSDHQFMQSKDIVIIDSQTKLKIVKLRKYYDVLYKKLKKQIEKERKNNPSKLTNVCKFCGTVFSSGREMGGHISRMHSGLSESFKHKTRIHLINREQRNRRENLKKAYLRIKQVTPKKSQKSSGLNCFERSATIDKTIKRKEQNEEIFFSKQQFHD